MMRPWTLIAAALAVGAVGADPAPGCFGGARNAGVRLELNGETAASRCGDTLSLERRRGFLADGLAARTPARSDAPLRVNHLSLLGCEADTTFLLATLSKPDGSEVYRRICLENREIARLRPLKESASTGDLPGRFARLGVGTAMGLGGFGLALANLDCPQAQSWGGGCSESDRQPGLVWVGLGAGVIGFYVLGTAFTD